MKKVLVSVLLVLLCIIGGLYVAFVKSANEDNLQEEMLKLSDYIVKHYRGEEESLDSFKTLEPKVMDKAKRHMTELKDSMPTRFNVTEYYDSIWGNEEMQYEIGDSGSVDDLDSEGNPIEYVDDVDGESSENDDLVIDSRIFYEDDVAYIEISDMKFKEGFDSVIFEGVDMIVGKDAVPLSYDNMIRNTAYYFNYDMNKFVVERDSSYMDVLYKSIDGSNTILIRVLSEDNKITDFEVISNEVN